MPRGSDKHSPRLDESLERDTRSLTHGSPSEARSDEGRVQEGPADDEPTPDALLSGDRGLTDADVLDHDEVETRSTMASYFRPSVWPADREALMAVAREEHAPHWVIERLSQLPNGIYTHTEAAWEALGGRVELRP